MPIRVFDQVSAEIMRCRGPIFAESVKMMALFLPAEELQFTHLCAADRGVNMAICYSVQITIQFLLVNWLQKCIAEAGHACQQRADT